MFSALFPHPGSRLWLAVVLVCPQEPGDLRLEITEGRGQGEADCLHTLHKGKIGCIAGMVTKVLG